MAIQEYVIKPAGDTVPNGIQLTGQYQFKPGWMRVLLSEDEFGEFKESDKDLPAPHGFTFVPTFMQKIYRFDTDSEDDHDVKARNVVENFWQKHPLLTINGQPGKYTRQGAELFDIFSRKDKSNESFAKWDKERQVSNRIAEFDMPALRDICYYYGFEPKGKLRAELVYELAKPNTGLAQSDPMFLKTFSGETNSEKDFNINLRKAIMYGIISNKTKDNRNNYYLSDEFLGISFDDVVMWAKNNERTYKEHVLRAVKNQDEKTHGKDEIVPTDLGGKDNSSTVILPGEKPKSKGMSAAPNV